MFLRLKCLWIPDFKTTLIWKELFLKMPYFINNRSSVLSIKLIFGVGPTYQRYIPLNVFLFSPADSIYHTPPPVPYIKGKVYLWFLEPFFVLNVDGFIKTNLWMQFQKVDPVF